MQQNRREAVRRKTYLGGRLVFNRRLSTMDCLLRNMSDSGARLEFTNTAAVPDEFDLQVRHLQRTMRARAVWRRANEMGITFLDSGKGDNVVPLDLAIRLRKLESEKAALKRRVTQLTEGE